MNITLEEAKKELGKDLQLMIKEMDMAEKINMQLLLSLAVGGLAPDSKDTKDEKNDLDKAAFGIALELMTEFREAGLVKRERPDFMTDELLNSLIKESEANKENRVRPGLHFLAPAGPIGESFSLSDTLTNYVADALGKEVIPNGIGSYLFYELPGDGIPAHVDSDVFSINCIIGLTHETEENVDKQSALVVYSNDGEPTSIILEPGELVLLLAGGSVHAREPVVEGEKVSILTIGFRNK